jgi:hypothetical protein
MREQACRALLKKPEEFGYIYLKFEGIVVTRPYSGFFSLRGNEQMFSHISGSPFLYLNLLLITLNFLSLFNNIHRFQFYRYQQKKD